ncbi:MAG: hypothetical protein ACKV0T_28970, partial [Planctomycetales bacterium]
MAPAAGIRQALGHTMGVMRFLVHPESLLADWAELYRAYVSGVDHAAWPTRIEVDGHLLIVRRQNSDSGKLNVACPVPGFGRPMVTTASLPEREQPYVLAVELARGKIVQVRNQFAFWHSAGMSIPQEFLALHREAHRLLGQAVSVQDDPQNASEISMRALSAEFGAAEILTRSYTEQRLEMRHRQYPQLPTILGCSLGDSVFSPQQEAQFLEAFHGAA